MRVRFDCVLLGVRSVRPSLGARQFAIMPAVLGGLCGALLPASESLAACAPATGEKWQRQEGPWQRIREYWCKDADPE